MVYDHAFVAALFFVSYEAVKRSLRYLLPTQHQSSPLLFMAAASLGEIAACSVRVPAEVLKQRMQVLRIGEGVGLRQAAAQLYRQEGSLGFYRGFQATIQREIPFACLQYPMYEYLKGRISKRHGSNKSDWWIGACCGSLAGAFAGLLTTPLDVIKTRTILAKGKADSPHSNPAKAMVELFRESDGAAAGLRRLFSGALPRTCWIALGGLIFFGAYEKTIQLADTLTSPPPPSSSVKL